MDVHEAAEWCGPTSIAPEVWRAMQVFLWPVAGILLCLPFTLLFGFNPTRFTLNIYFG